MNDKTPDPQFEETFEGSDEQPIDPVSAPADYSELDTFVPDFVCPQIPGYVRLDSRRWLVAPERYIFRPLRALAAMQQCDALAASGYGKALIGFAFKVRAQREALRAMIRESFSDALASGMEIDVEDHVDATLGDHVRASFEEMLGEAKGLQPYEWARGWLIACDVRRVPLPSRCIAGAENFDTGGPVLLAKGPSAWDVYYARREVHLLHLAAACAWYSIGSFFADLRA